MDKYIGKMLDNRYEILEVIGVGGMAVVYKARCHRLNRFVAVKVLKEDFHGDNDFRRRFHAESQAVAMLSHPNIVAVYDVSRSADVEYIVMELIDGITLKQYMQKKGALNWRESLHFITQIVKALSHAHGRGIIHRDIKPHNIMILRDGSVKVADFGIARFASKQNTLTQEALGSVHYISPEQARGSHIDARSDLYSVGVVLYEMLTGRLPYVGDSPVSVAIQHISSMPLSPKEINPAIPDALEEITKKAMSANPARRYASAEEMLTALEEFRKNPAISFQYDLSDSSLGLEDQATKKLPREEISAAGRPNRPKRPPSSKRRTHQQAQDDEDLKTRRTNSTVATLTGVLGVMVFLFVLVYIVLELVGSITKEQEDKIHIIVPMLTNQRYDAERFSDEYPDFEFTIQEEPSTAYEKGIIFEQSPPRNAQVLAGQVITLTISSGPRTHMLPDMINENYKNAQFRLTDLGLIFNTELKRETHDEIPKDFVIRTEPAFGTIVAEGDMITLVVSLGPEVKNHPMPQLEGQLLETVMPVLEGFLITPIPTYVDSEQPAGTILSQSITANTEVPEGSTVELTVSNGALVVTDPPESTPPPTETAPPTSTPPPFYTPPPTDTQSPPETSPPLPGRVTESVIVDFSRLSPNTQVRVVIEVQGSVKHDYMHNTSEGSFTFPVTGYIGDTVVVYIDGQTMQYYELNDN
ncbi:MAG: Stk1 family PASTA domain-containing Ser/Thr kinase [Oscillospiraceae bacterium]|jgi:serine/threonine-protein kinase|nr:Stk1 family PASTA domain-containing Ser/Thr kinase [Oscillospiraceae bacterium]